MRSLTIHTVAFLCLLTCFCSCSRKELPVPAHDPGNVIATAVSMDASYKWQIYFNLKENTVVGQNLKTAWDLGFEATAQGYHIVLNSSKSMFARNTNKKDFASVTWSDTSGFASTKRWDAANGNLDSTAIGDWRSAGTVYIIDRGYNELGQPQGFEKVQFQLVNEYTYTVCIAALNETNGITLSIPKDSAYNFTFLSFNGGQIVTAEPPKKDWDLVFSQYTHVFYDPFTPYLVTGCLLNHYRTAAYMDTSAAFTQIGFANITDNKLSAAINVIGYDWKTFTGSRYVTNPKLNYVVRDANGLYYKLHFTDFYDSGGQKGTPKFEYQQL